MVDTADPVAAQTPGTDPEAARARLLELSVSEVRLPIGARMLPPWQRHRLSAIHRFAALTRMVADEVEEPGTDLRSAMLDVLEDDVDLIAGHHRPHHPDVRPMRRLVRHHQLPMALLHKLIAAARQDLLTSRYARYDDLWGYCLLSGGAVGELVVAALSRRPVGQVSHDDVVTVYAAARLLLLCGTVSEDARRGRIYLPQTDLETMDAREQHLVRDRLTHALRGTVETQAHRAVYQLQAARPGLRRLPIPARIAVAGMYAEACALMNGLERSGFEVAQGPLPAYRSIRPRVFLRAVLGR